MHGVERVAILGAGAVGAAPAAWDALRQTHSPQGRTSTLQDIDAGRKAEVKILAGKAVELARIHGVPTPMNEMAFHIIRTLEGNAG